MTSEQVSIIIPTYNESLNIKKILQSIGDNLPLKTKTEAIVIDDDSPDGTAKIVEDYLKTMKSRAEYTISIIKRKGKQGLSSAILKGIQQSTGDTIIVMDSDFSHPPNIIPKMIEKLKQTKCDIVVASRYVKGGATQGWPLSRKIMSTAATKIAKKGLGIDTRDPMSGYFAFRRQIIDGLKFDAIGYKMLLEILVKTKGVSIQEVPYTFSNRTLGSSKLGVSTIFDYGKAIWKLYLYGKKENKKEKPPSAGFLSTAARFFTVGTSGLVVNYLISLFFVTSFTELWYVYANLIAIAISMTSNFILNKAWTFEDRNFSIKRTLNQYSRFVMFSSLGALVQLGMVFYLVEEHQIVYPIALIVAVFIAAFSNFMLNKRWTFNEKFWS